MSYAIDFDAAQAAITEACEAVRGTLRYDPEFVVLRTRDAIMTALRSLPEDATVGALRAELAEAVRVLSELEWVRHDWGGCWGFECPCCGAHDHNDKEEHEDGCDLAAFLARHGGA